MTLKPTHSSYRGSVGRRSGSAPGDGRGAAAVDSANTSIPVDPTTQIEMHVNANCVLAQARCFFDTRANLLTPDGPATFPQDVWARQTITLRSTGRDVWQEAEYSAPVGMPRETKGANQNNVLSKLFKTPSSNEISITYFGGGPIETLCDRRQFGADRLEHRASEYRRRFHRLLTDPGGVRRRESHRTDGLRADPLQTLARQAQQPFTGEVEQDLLGTAGDRQAAGVEEVEHLGAVHRACALGEVHPELGQRLSITHADQLARTGLRAGVAATDRQLRDALVK